MLGRLRMDIDLCIASLQMFLSTTSYGKQSAIIRDQIASSDYLDPDIAIQNALAHTHVSLDELFADTGLASCKV